MSDLFDKNGEELNEEMLDLDEDLEEADLTSQEKKDASNTSKAGKSDNDEYEDVCFVCRRPESKAGKMFKMPNNICVCDDCMHKTMDMVSQFGGRLWEQNPDGNVLVYDFPNSYKEYIKAFVPMAGGEDAPHEDKVNVNGNILGSWNFSINYETVDWKVRAYYEHYYEDHSGLLGFDYHTTHEGVRKLITYLPWRDGLYGWELTVPKNRIVSTIVYEYLTSRDQSGPVLHNSGESLPEQAGGMDHYYNHEYFQSWQHWGMAICNPHTLSPLYNGNFNLTMPYQRLRSHHLGLDGSPHASWQYRVMASWSKHWGSVVKPLPNPQTQLSMMGEVTYCPMQCSGWQFSGALAFDRSGLIGNNFGGMLTICYTGRLKTEKK